MKTYTIHFLRHGQTDGNLKGQYIGVTDLPLTTNGIEELQSLKNDDGFPYVDAVFCGPLKRCVQSAEIMYPLFDPIIIDEITEYNFGEFEGKTADMLENLPEFIDWTSGKVPNPPGGENSLDFTKRLCLGLNKIVREMMKKEIFEAACVVHGGVMMSLFAATALPRRQMVEWVCGPGEGFTAVVTPSLYARSGIIEIVSAIK